MPSKISINLNNKEVFYVKYKNTFTLHYSVSHPSASMNRDVLKMVLEKH